LYQFKLDFSEFKILIIITRVTGKKIIKTSRKEIGGLRMVVYHCGKKKKSNTTDKDGKNSGTENYETHRKQLTV